MVGGIAVAPAQPRVLVGVATATIGGAADGAVGLVAGGGVVVGDGVVGEGVALGVAVPVVGVALFSIKCAVTVAVATTATDVGAGVVATGGVCVSVAAAMPGVASAAGETGDSFNLAHNQ